MQVEYNARLAASARLIQDEADRKAEKKLYARRIELQAEAESLRQEEKEYKRRKRSLERKRTDGPADEGSRMSCDTSMEREQHYQQWLATQVYLDAIQNADIENTGESGIPPKEKHPQYGSMPKEWRAAKRQKRQEQRNATAGPSRLATGHDNCDKSNHD
jgi:hypothetical protein